MTWKDPQAKADYMAARYRRLKKSNPQRQWIFNLRSKSRKQGWEFNLTAEDLPIPSHCPVLGIPLLWEGSRDNLPSVDRINNDRGYVKGNVEVISWRANWLKANATVEEMKRMATYYEQKSRDAHTAADKKSPPKRGRRKVV